MTAGLKTSMVVILLALVCGVSLSLAEQQEANKPPLAFPVKDVKLKIVGATFVSRLQGVSKRFEATRPEKFRGVVLTVEVRKPAGMELTFVAQDFNLHYRYGAKSDVSRCQGLSTFSVQKDIDRPMKLINNVGRMSTGISTVKAKIVFIDLFFQYMERDTSKLHLFVAQPVSASFQTKGWEG